MAIFKTVLDFVKSGAAWTVRSAIDRGTGFAGAIRGLTERYGQDILAYDGAAANFIGVVKEAASAADKIREGTSPSPQTIPTVEGLPSSQRYQVSGIVRMTAPELGDPDKPLSTTLPFQQDSPTVPTLNDIRINIEQSIQEAEDAYEGESPKGEKKREKAEYIRRLGEAVEYDFTPLLVFKSH